MRRDPSKDNDPSTTFGGAFIPVAISYISTLRLQFDRLQALRIDISTLRSRRIEDLSISLAPRLITPDLPAWSSACRPASTDPPQACHLRLSLSEAAGSTTKKAGAPEPTSDASRRGVRFKVESRPGEGQINPLVGKVMRKPVVRVGPAPNYVFGDSVGDRSEDDLAAVSRVITLIHIDPRRHEDTSKVGLTKAREDAWSARRGALTQSYR